MEICVAVLLHLHEAFGLPQTTVPLAPTDVTLLGYVRHAVYRACRSISGQENLGCAEHADDPLRDVTPVTRSIVLLDVRMRQTLPTRLARFQGNTPSLVPHDHVISVN